MMYSGYGICVDDIKTSIADIKLLIALAPNLAQELAPYIEELECDFGPDDNPHDFAMELTDGLWDGQEGGLHVLMAKVIEECEGVRLVGVNACDCTGYLILEDKAPWEYNDKEKALTEDGLRLMLNRYIGVLSAGNNAPRSWSLMLMRQFIEVD